MFIRINPDEQSFNIFNARNIIHRQIKTENKKLVERKTRESLIGNIKNDLAEIALEYKGTNSTATKCLKYVRTEILPKYKNKNIFFKGQ